MKFNGIIKSVTRLDDEQQKLFALWSLYLLGKRTANVFLDPIVENDSEYVLSPFALTDKKSDGRGQMSDEAIDNAAKALFKWTSTLNIGLYAEPMMSKDVKKIITLARENNVPHISLVSNGQLIQAIMLKQYIDAGLNELVLTLAATSKEMYESLSKNNSFDKLIELIEDLRKVKRIFPQFKVTVLFPVTEQNFSQLNGFYELVGDGVADKIEIRPARNGKEKGKTPVKTLMARQYDVIAKLKEESAERGVEFDCPTPEQLKTPEHQPSDREKLIDEVTYCYVGPGICYAPDFNAAKDSYRTYHRRKNTGKLLRKNIFGEASDGVDNKSEIGKSGYGRINKG